MRPSKVCVLTFSGLAFLTSGLVFTLASWFATPVTSLIPRLHLIGPLCLLAGAVTVALACLACVAEQKGWRFQDGFHNFLLWCSMILGCRNNGKHNGRVKFQSDTDSSGDWGSSSLHIEDENTQYLIDMRIECPQCEHYLLRHGFLPFDEHPHHSTLKPGHPQPKRVFRRVAEVPSRMEEDVWVRSSQGPGLTSASCAYYDAYPEECYPGPRGYNNRCNCAQCSRKSPIFHPPKEGPPSGVNSNIPYLGSSNQQSQQVKQQSHTPTKDRRKSTNSPLEQNLNASQREMAEITKMKTESSEPTKQSSVISRPRSAFDRDSGFRLQEFRTDSSDNTELKRPRPRSLVESVYVNTTTQTSDSALNRNEPDPSHVSQPVLEQSKPDPLKTQTLNGMRRQIRPVKAEDYQRPQQPDYSVKVKSAFVNVSKPSNGLNIRNNGLIKQIDNPGMNVGHMNSQAPKLQVGSQTNHLGLTEKPSAPVMAGSPVNKSSAHVMVASPVNGLNALFYIRQEDNRMCYEVSV